MAQIKHPLTIRSNRKAITAFFPYAVWRERDGEHGMIDAFLSVSGASASGRMWKVIGPFIPFLLDGVSPQTRVLVSPYVPWDSELLGEGLVTR